MAYVYKQFTAQDKALIPFNAHKQYNFTSASAASNQLTHYSTRFTSESYDIYSTHPLSASVDFINTMSKPESVNLDNLVQLYRLNNGGAAQQANPSQPSQEFKQMQNAQQVPSPMGVLPSGQSGADTRTAEDKIMDTMIGNFNSKNPWK